MMRRHFTPNQVSTAVLVAAVLLFVACLTWLLVLDARCRHAGGVLVRGAFWFTCQANHPVP